MPIVHLAGLRFEALEGTLFVVPPNHYVIVKQEDICILPTGEQQDLPQEEPKEVPEHILALGEELKGLMRRGRPIDPNSCRQRVFKLIENLLKHRGKNGASGTECRAWVFDQLKDTKFSKGRIYSSINSAPDICRDDENKWILSSFKD